MFKLDGVGQRAFSIHLFPINAIGLIGSNVEMTTLPMLNVAHSPCLFIVNCMFPGGIQILIFPVFQNTAAGTRQVNFCLRN